MFASSAPKSHTQGAQSPSAPPGGFRFPLPRAAGPPGRGGGLRPTDPLGGEVPSPHPRRLGEPSQAPPPQPALPATHSGRSCAASGTARPTPPASGSAPGRAPRKSTQGPRRLAPPPLRPTGTHGVLAWDWGTSDARRNPPPQGSTAEQLLPHGRRACAVVAGDTAGFGDRRKDSGFAPHRLPRPTWDRAGPSLATRPSLGSPAPGTPEREGGTGWEPTAALLPAPHAPPLGDLGVPRGLRGGRGPAALLWHPRQPCHPPQGCRQQGESAATGTPSAASLARPRHGGQRPHPAHAAPVPTPTPAGTARPLRGVQGTWGPAHRPVMTHGPTGAPCPRRRHGERRHGEHPPTPTSTSSGDCRGLSPAQPRPCRQRAAAWEPGTGLQSWAAWGAGRVWGAWRVRGRGCPPPQAWGADAAAPLRFARPPPSLLRPFARDGAGRGQHAAAGAWPGGPGSPQAAGWQGRATGGLGCRQRLPAAGKEAAPHRQRHSAGPLPAGAGPGRPLRNAGGNGLRTHIFHREHIWRRAHLVRGAAAAPGARLTPARVRG